MTDKNTGGAARRRRRRPSAELERLEALRRERAEQLQRVRDNERRVDEALGPFAEAVTAIEDARRRLDVRLGSLHAALERKLADLAAVKLAKVAENDILKAEAAAATDEEIARWRAVMAGAVRNIRDADVGAAETAALLGVTVKEQAALVREGAPDAVEALPRRDSRGTSDQGDDREQDDDSPAGTADAPAGEGRSAVVPDGGVGMQGFGEPDVAEERGPWGGTSEELTARDEFDDGAGEKR